MKTIATMALLLGTIAVGIAPAAQAHEAPDDRYETSWQAQRHGFGHGPQRGVLHARQVREVRQLAFRLERATDELASDARREAGRIDHGEAHAIRAVYRLENVADRFNRQVQRRGPLTARELRGELRQVEDALRDARRITARFVHSHELRGDFRRIAKLVEELDEAVEPGRRFAGHGGWGWGYRVAGR